MNNSWAKATLRDFVKLQRGHDLPESRRRRGHVPVIGSAGITGYHDTARAKGPGVTVGRSGASFGVVSYSPVDYWPHNAALYVTDFQGNNERFAYYLLKSLDFKSFNSGSAQQSLNRNFIYPIPIRIPPLPIQRRIAAILSAYDDLIENNSRRIQILEEMARRIYEEWFVRFRFPGHENVRMVESELGMMPAGWEVKRLGDISNIQWGDTTKTKKAYVDVGYDAFSASGLDGRLPYYDFDHDGIVLSAIGAQCGLTWFARGKWSCIKNTMRYWSINTEISNEYLFWSSRGQEFWTRRGAAQPFISLGDARNLRILKPTKNLLQRYESIAVPAMRQVNLLERKNVNLRCTLDLLLPKLISGEIDVFNFPEPVTD